LHGVIHAETDYIQLDVLMKYDFFILRMKNKLSGTISLNNGR